MNETTTYLEMTDRWALIPAKTPSVEVEVRQAEIPCPELNRFFYTAIGGDWFWIDRLPWTFEQWMACITRPGYETWVAYVRGTPVGYFELDQQPDVTVHGDCPDFRGNDAKMGLSPSGCERSRSGGDIELAFFGILPRFSGKGIGGHLLTSAINRAWEKGATRVWVHTSSFDHPQALSNYLARGFRVVKAETFPKDVPDEPLGPWPGAQRLNRCLLKRLSQSDSAGDSGEHGGAEGS